MEDHFFQQGVEQETHPKEDAPFDDAYGRRQRALRWALGATLAALSVIAVAVQFGSSASGVGDAPVVATAPTVVVGSSGTAVVVSAPAKSAPASVGQAAPTTQVAHAAHAAPTAPVAPTASVAPAAHVAPTAPVAPTASVAPAAHAAPTAPAAALAGQAAVANAARTAISQATQVGQVTNSAATATASAPRAGAVANGSPAASAPRAGAIANGSPTASASSVPAGVIPARVIPATVPPVRALPAGVIPARVIPAMVRPVAATTTLTATTRMPSAQATLEQSCQSAFDRKRYKDVIDNCSRAFEAKPHAAQLAAYVAEVEFNRGRPAQALSWAQKAASANPSLPDAYVFIGGAEQQSGHAQAAKVAYLKYLQLAPNGRFASDLRAVVRGL